MESLKKYLNQIPSGDIEDTSELEKLLAECWDQLSGDDGGMKGYKLLGRMEEVVWDPPNLWFTIGRHGAVMMGSTRAELQDWGVDIERKEAYFSISGYREIYPRQSPLNVKPIAEKYAKLIINRKKHEHLKHFPDGRIQIYTGKILPEERSPKETRIARRKRFRRELSALLLPHGWKEKYPNYFTPPDDKKK